MPRLSVWTIRASLVYLALGFTTGGWMLLNKGLLVNPTFWKYLPAHIEFLLYGWIVQLILGVAFWILPRFSRVPRRGNEPLAWASFVLLNLGIGLSGIGPLLSSATWLPPAGQAALAGSALSFALHAWPRVKPSK